VSPHQQTAYLRVGTRTLSTATFSITTHSITTHSTRGLFVTLNITSHHHYAEWLVLIIVTPNVIMLSVVMLNVIVLITIMPTLKTQPNSNLMKCQVDETAI
jgi:hypothetical protein